MKSLPSFGRFVVENFDFSDQPPPGRPPTIMWRNLKGLLDVLSSHCLTEQVHCSHTVIENHIHSLRFTWKYSVWLTYKQTKFQLQKIVDACVKLLSWVMLLQEIKNTSCLFVCLYERRVPTPHLDTKKVISVVWLEISCIIYRQLLPFNMHCCEQLDCIAS